MQDAEGVQTGLEPDPKDAIAAEVGRILRSPAFQRSEVLSRLLTYLVRMTAEGRSVKAFEIAVDGLGRAEQESVDSDTYARVVVARLRKALASYYATGAHDRELYIDPGSYVLRIKDREPESSQAESTGTLPGRSAQRQWNLSTGVLIAVVIASLLATWYLAFRTDEKVWARPNFPNISVARSATPTPQSEECRNQLITALGGYTGIRVVDAGAPAEYEIRIVPDAVDGKSAQLIRLVNLRTNRFLWSRAIQSGNQCLDETETWQAAQSIAAPGGVIESFARRFGVDSQTPYGCWLQFTQGAKTFTMIGNDGLQQCARDWYAVAPEHPVAALLYSWTLTDKASVALAPGSRRELLDEALKVGNEAFLLNSEVATLHLARMRAHSYLGDRQATVAAAREALQHAQNNPIILGMAASGLVQWNEADGERILLDLPGYGNQRMPWEVVGLYVAAMMRDDVKAAGVQVAEMANFDTGQPVLRILKAAYLARAGKRKEADAVLASLASNPLVRLAGTDRIVARLPAAPEVKKQLANWLAAGSGKSQRPAHSPA